MVNFGLNSASILGIFLAVAGAALYFLRSVRPELSRDHDIFFAAVGLLCGFILLFQGWRLDPILQFGQLLLTGSTIFFAVESIRLRDVATKQAKQNTRIVDEDRPVSPRYEYEAEIDDDLEPLEEQRFTRPQIQPSRDSRRRGYDEYEDEGRRRTRTDEYEDENRRRPSTRTSSSERLGKGDRISSRRRPRPVNRPPERPEQDEWGSAKRSNEDWEAPDSAVSNRTRSSGNGSSRSESRNPDVAARPRKRRPPQDSVARREPDIEATPTDYVDYKPIARSDDELDNSSNFDEP